jgi:metallo-beta-lactamase family protein
VKLHFLGATRQVTGSRFCLEWSGHHVLIDCGMFQEREFVHRNWDPFPIPAGQIDAVILTHAHIDHCGLIPRLVRQGFSGPIYMTRPSADLVEVMWRDAARIQEEDLAYKQKRHRKESRTSPHPYEPLYTEHDAERSIPLVQGVPRNSVVRVTEGVEVTFHDAGHILGSVSLRVTVHQGGQPLATIVFSGDVGQDGKPLICDPVRHQQADYLVLESTYGDRLHRDAGDVSRQMRDIINATVERGGKVVIPTFAVERAQELMYLVAQLVHQDHIPRLPVFLDSPMAIDVTDIFLRHADWLDKETRQLLSSGSAPLRFPGLQMSRSVEESKAINDVDGPALILSTSGMCDAGRIKHHLRNHIGDARSTILFVGFQSQGTLGRLILDGRKEVRIHGRNYKVRAQLAQIFGFSGHADRDGLLRWIDALKSPPKRTFLVHGEESSALALADTIRKRGWRVDVPDYHESVEIE